MSESLMISMLTNIQSDVTDLRRKIDDLVKLDGELRMTQQTVARLEGEIHELQERVNSLEDKVPVTGLVTKMVFALAGAILLAVFIALAALVIRNPNLARGSVPQTTYESQP